MSPDSVGLLSSSQKKVWGSRESIYLLKCLSSSHEDVSLDSLHLCKKLGPEHSPVIPALNQ